jgi:two-component system OmpR family response regulator
MRQPNILVVEDDAVTRVMVSKILTDEGYTVFAASSGVEALSVLRVKSVAMVLLDRGLPDSEGLELIRQIRKFSQAPIIVLSSKGNWVDKVVGLELGADDYLAKPFEKQELLARVKAQIRRFHQQSDKDEGAALVQPGRKIRFGHWTLNTWMHQVFDDNGTSADLTTAEFNLLAVLVKNHRRVMTRSNLIDQTHSGGFAMTDRAIDIQVSRIRRKLWVNHGESALKTIRGVGYLLDCDTKILD